MNRVISFLIAGLFFAVFNVSTVAAQAPQEDCAAAPTPALAAECWDRQAPGAIPGAGDAAAVVPGVSGAATTGSDDVVCGGLAGKLLETNCLRDVLDGSEFDVRTENQKKKGKRGNYGCGNSDRATHTACLRAILHSNDNTLAPGTN